MLLKRKKLNVHVFCCWRCLFVEDMVIESVLDCETVTTKPELYKPNLGRMCDSVVFDSIKFQKLETMVSCATWMSSIVMEHQLFPPDILIMLINVTLCGWTSHYGNIRRN